MAVAAIAGGATYAYFSDTATLSGSTFSAGTLDLKIDSDKLGGNQSWVDSFAAPANFLTNMKPGDTGAQIIDIKSDGTIKGGIATLDLNRTSAWSDLAGVLKFRVYFDANNTGSWVDTGLNGTVDQYTKAYDLGEIKSGSGIASVKIEWSVPASAGNNIQGDSVTLDAIFGLNQVANQVN